ncbi:MAG: hypothetical protein AB7L92_02645 [Alphaproteobacteria bacterium]
MKIHYMGVLLLCTSCSALRTFESLPCPTCTLPKKEVPWQYFDFSAYADEGEPVPKQENEPAIPHGTSRPCVSSQLNDPGCNE